MSSLLMGIGSNLFFSHNFLDPHIKLYDKNGNVVENLSITKWNTDTVQEFFETHLEDEPDYLKTNKI